MYTRASNIDKVYFIYGVKLIFGVKFDTKIKKIKIFLSYKKNIFDLNREKWGWPDGGNNDSAVKKKIG